MRQNEQPLESDLKDKEDMSVMFNKVLGLPLENKRLIFSTLINVLLLDKNKKYDVSIINVGADIAKGMSEDEIDDGFQKAHENSINHPVMKSIFTSYAIE